MNSRLYTCPMHTEVVQEGPGTCPKCGMALEPKVQTSTATKTEYVCPMHTEVVQSSPGTCPKCGMALEPRSAPADGVEENTEYRDMRRRFIVGSVLTVPLVAIAMRDLIPGGRSIETLAAGGALGWLELALATPVMLWAGWPFFVRGVQ